jgi:hypothetical protein
MFASFGTDQILKIDALRTPVRNLFNTILLMKCILIVQLISFDTLR